MRTQVGIDFRALTGKSVLVYGQTEITKDLNDARVSASGELYFEARDLSIQDV